MLFASDTSTPPRKHAVFTVGSHAISAAIISNKKKPEILWSEKVGLHLSRDSESEQLHIMIQRKLAKLVEAVRQEQGGGYDIARVHCLFAEPWHTNNITTTKTTSPKPSLLTKDRLASVVAKARDRLEGAGSESDQTYLSQRIIGVAADGEPITFPYKNSAKEFKVRVHVSRLPKRLQQFVGRVFQQHFHPSKTQLHSLTDVINRFWEREHSLANDFAVMMSGPNHISTSQMKGGRLHSVARDSVGEDYLVEVLSQALDRPVSDIRSRLSLQKRRKQHQDASRAIQIGLDEAGGHLSEVFSRHLRDTNGKPQHVYLITTDRIEGEIFRNYTEQTARMHNLHVHTVSGGMFENQFSNQSPIDHIQALGILGAVKYSK